MKRRPFLQKLGIAGATGWLLHHYEVAAHATSLHTNEKSFAELKKEVLLDLKNEHVSS